MLIVFHYLLSERVTSVSSLQLKLELCLKIKTISHALGLVIILLFNFTDLKSDTFPWQHEEGKTRK